MQAIQTKYLPATNTKPSRIKAWCEAGSVTIDYPYEYDESGAHLYAALSLQNKLVWNGPYYGELHQGALPNNTGYCHVMVKA